MVLYIIKECKKHGSTEHSLDTTNRYRCKKCRVDAVTRRRLKVKKQAVEYKGGKCEKCNYDKCLYALEFHHIGNDKEFTISWVAYARAWDKVKKELDKCILVCANCHRELHYGLGSSMVEQ